MSVIVALKFDKGVIIGADKQTTFNGTKEQCTKIFKYQYSNTAIGVSGILSDSQLLQYQDEIVDYRDIVLKTDIDIKYVFKNTCEKIKQLFKDNGKLHTDTPEYIDSHITFATKDRIFDIGYDFQFQSAINIA